MSDTNENRIIVVVSGDRYECYGPDTPMSRLLKKLIDDLGGINESVPDGCYHFSAKIAGSEIVDVSLTPFEE